MLGRVRFDDLLRVVFLEILACLVLSSLLLHLSRDLSTKARYIFRRRVLKQQPGNSFIAKHPP